MGVEARGLASGRTLGLALALSLVTLWRAPVPLGPPATATSAWPGACPSSAGQIIRVSVPSRTYGVPVTASVYLPPCYAQGVGPLPVIYLLHGGNADETQWPDLRVQAEADALIVAGAEPFVVVMPGGAYGANVDYGGFVLNDLLPAM
jgi:enterochelin esterase-like enzyme